MFVSRVALLAALAVSSSSSSPAAQAVGAVTGTNISGTIDLLEIDDPNDVWSGGRMVVNGQVVIIPRNLIIQLPANWLTLQQIFDQAPPAAKAIGKSGLATIDGPGFGGFANVLGNRTGFGNVIAGDIFIEKGREVANGMVTFINHTDGYLRIDGLVGDDTTGLMIRINDPTGRHTIQSGKGCDGGPNCSPDPRFTNDPDNYTIAFATGGYELEVLDLPDRKDVWHQALNRYDAGILKAYLVPPSLAGIEDLARAPGIGTSLAQAIYEHLHPGAE